MAHQTIDPPTRLGGGPSAPRPAGHGWAVFAGTMFLVLAGMNALYGISALANDDYFAVDELLFGDLAAWGVLSLVFAVFQCATGIAILRQRAFGAFVGIILVSLHAVTSLFYIGAYPLWTTVALVVDGLIIYGLTVHGADWA